MRKLVDARAAARAERLGRGIGRTTFANTELPTEAQIKAEEVRLAEEAKVKGWPEPRRMPEQFRTKDLIASADAEHRRKKHSIMTKLRPNAAIPAAEVSVTRAESTRAERKTCACAV